MKLIVLETNSNASANAGRGVLTARDRPPVGASEALVISSVTLAFTPVFSAGSCVALLTFSQVMNTSVIVV